MPSISDKFLQPGRNFLGVEHPILGGAMTWVSNPKLVAAICNAGGFASLAGGNAPVEILQQQIDETRALTNKPFGVNLITIAPAYRSQMELIKRMELPFVIFAGSFPRKREIQFVKESGAKVLAFASTHSIATRMMEWGADALILEGAEAGGHIGHVSLSILLQQVLFEIGGFPVFVAGGIGTGRMAAHLLLMGAWGIQLGTHFAVAEESCAHPNFKSAFIKANARDAVSTPQVDSKLPVVAVRSLRNKGTDDFSKLQVDLLAQMAEGDVNRVDAQNKVEEFWMGSLRRAVVEGDIEHGSLMAGQSVGLVDGIKPVKSIIEKFMANIESELLVVKGKLS